MQFFRQLWSNKVLLEVIMAKNYCKLNGDVD